MKKLRFACIWIMIAGLLFCAGCSLKTDEDRQQEEDEAQTEAFQEPEELVENAMDALVEGDGEEALFLGVDGTRVALSPSTGLAAAITSQVEYAIQEIEIDGENGTVILEITAPDAAAAMQEALQGMDAYDAEVFTANMEALLEDAATVTYTVEAELVQVDGYWCLALNSELSNAITGGLLEEYARLQQSVIDAMVEGGDE